MEDNDNKKAPDGENKYKDIKKGFRAYSKIITISLNLVVTILMGVVIGILLDKWLDTKYFITICIFLFSGVAMYNFFKEIMKVK